ncbi:MAG: metallophosphoesterase [Pseudomonadota bacterium]
MSFRANRSWICRLESVTEPPGLSCTGQQLPIGRSNRVLLNVLVATLLTVCAQFGLAATRDGRWALDDVAEVVAIADIHGAHDAFKNTLVATGLIDAEMRWSGGDRHLMFVGDVLDRGDDSRAAMDLLMRLEEEAPRAGGAVHVVLGNHELMNLVGDLRYVARGEYLAFADEETAAQRDAAFAVFQKRRTASGATGDRAAFDDQYPPGFFAHRAAFASDGRYGRWLLEKPLALRINTTLFIHAGLSDTLAELGLEGVNGRLRAELVEYLKVYEALIDLGVLDVMMDFYALPDILEAQSLAGAAADLAGRLLELHDSALHGPESPAWYRGNVGCSPLIEQDRLTRTLRAFGSTRVVVGHTPTYQRRIWQRFGGRVLLIDTGMQTAYYGGQGAALLLDEKTLRAVYEEEGSAAQPVERLPLRSGVLAGPFADLEQLEQALAEGTITAREEDRLTLSWQGQVFAARFQAAGRGGEFLPAVAAYRLDRVLELGMVPAAVPRTVGGVVGSVRHLPPKLVSEARRQAESLYLPAWCPLAEQFQAVRLFDALLRNTSRSGETLSYGVARGQIVLTGHGNSFSTRGGLVKQPGGAELPITDFWRSRLELVSGDAARDDLVAVLGARRYKALARRAGALAELDGR